MIILLRIIKVRKYIIFAALALALASSAMVFLSVCDNAPDTVPASTDEPIKWMEFRASSKALTDAMNVDIKSNETDYPIDWTDIIAYLACIYGNDFSKYDINDIKSFTDQIAEGKTVEEICEGKKYFAYYKKTYSAVLAEFVGEYKSCESDEGETEKYGLKACCPIQSGYSFNHYDDFGASRSYGFRRKHLGNDLMGSIGTPIVAVESGYVEAIGWNRYGGWRIGIRSFDKKRYYYYAHLRKDKPYAANFEAGDEIEAGRVIGYLGMTGYSEKENVNNINIPHLHFGMQIIFDESQKDGNNEIWIDVYQIVRFLSVNR